MVDVNDLKLGELRLLETDNHLVLPVGVAIRVLITAVMYYIVGLFQRSRLRQMLCPAIKSSGYFNHETRCILWAM